jgi:hypothetical protein
VPRTPRGVTIDAPVEVVWPWLAHRYGQMGKQVVAAVLPKSHLVLMSEPDYDRVLRNEKAQGSWSFCLLPQGGRTRLLARSSGGAVGAPAFDIAHFVMEQRMLRGIRRRAERVN